MSDDREYGSRQLNRLAGIILEQGRHPRNAWCMATTGLRASSIEESMADIEAWTWYMNWSRKLKEVPSE